MVRIPRSGVLKGLILGLSLASVLSAWVTLVRLVAGTAPFTRAETTYPALLGLYYVGGLLIGLAWPLRKWLLGSAVLGVFGIFPLYFAALLMDSPRTQLFTQKNIGLALLLSCLAGGPIGVWSWLDTNPTRPVWLDALLFPRTRTLAMAWAVAIVFSGGSYFLLTGLMEEWPFGLVVVVFLLLFVAPLAVAIMMTLRFARRWEIPP